VWAFIAVSKLQCLNLGLSRIFLLLVTSLSQYINQTPFRHFKDKFLFRLYKELEELYNSALIHNDQREQFGIIERRGSDYDQNNY